ncbi:hypothetical protein ACHAW6_006753 [Cyclotella cf. meneghiniana]
MSNVHVQTSTLPSDGASSPSYDFISRGDEGIDVSSEMLCKESSSVETSLTTVPSRAHLTNQIDDGPSTTTSCRASQGQQATATEVSELVVKAKKAAASLWMILHSQSCHLKSCPHPHCSDTKYILSHVQACPTSSNPSCSCPTCFKGCNETRKLLAHYQKCKDLRSRQNTAQGKQYPQQTTCLVCSLMARYAKNIADKSPNKNAHIASATMPPLPRQRPRSESCPEQKSPERKSRSVKFAPCLRTTRYYHAEKDKSYGMSRRPRSASWGSNALGETILEESGERECTEEIVLPGSL